MDYPCLPSKAARGASSAPSGPTPLAATAVLSTVTSTSAWPLNGWRRGCLTHAISLYPDDAEAAEAWFRNGFGLIVVDGLRSLEPVAVEASAEVEIRQAGAADVDLVLPLSEGLERYLAGSPIFLPLLEKTTRADWEEWLAQPAHSLWLALHRGEAVAYLRAEPPSVGVTYLIVDDGTISITGAFTQPDWRGRGLSSALLNGLLGWAQGPRLPALLGGLREPEHLRQPLLAAPLPSRLPLAWPPGG